MWIPPASLIAVGIQERLQVTLIIMHAIYVDREDLTCLTQCIRSSGWYFRLRSLIHITCNAK